MFDYCISRKTNKACAMALGAAFAVSGVIITVLGFNLTFSNRWLWNLF